MQATENKQLLEYIFAAMEKGDTAPLVEAMSDDFRWVFPGNWSWSRTWGPKSEVLNGLLRPWRAQFNEYRSSADLIVADDERVVVQAHAEGVTVNGEAYDQTYCFIFRVANGKLLEVVEHCDTALVERVLVQPA